MTVYSISYDLRKAGRNYEKLYEELRRFPDRIHPLESLWFVDTIEDAAKVRDRLGTAIDSNDKLIVFKASAPAAWYGLNESDSQWLKQRLN